MQVKLIPIPGSGLDEINIKDQVFPIGRNHSPFQSYRPSVVGQLSRRHARIFNENGQFFIVDTGSRNGTTVNGQKLDDQPAVITNGDLISFSDKLTYNLVVNNQENSDGTDFDADAEACLTLTPTDENLEPIVIQRYPFLVSKTDQVFAKFSDKYGQDIRYLSRRHAYFSAKNGIVSVEDLGSTNGTYVNEQRLSDSPVVLNNGDIVGFGGKRFVYSVKIDIQYPVKEENSEVVNNEIETRLRESFDEQKTTFVASANSFLDIFCAEEEEIETPVNEEINADIDNPDEGPKPAKTPIGLFYRKAKIFLQQAIAALSEDKANIHRSRNRRIIALSLVLIIAVGIGFYWKGATKRNIQELMETANYERGLGLANEYLEKHPEDTDVQKIAIEALLKSRIPEWVSFIERNEYSNARDLITTHSEDITANNNQSAALIAILNWIANLDSFVHDRGGVDSPLIIFHHEEAITSLLDWWELDKEANRKSLRLIVNTVPQFKPIRDQTFSSLRTLQNEKSVYLNAIEQLKSDISEKMASNQTKELSSILDKFEKKYSRIQGIERVRSDWQNYRALEEAIDSKNLRVINAILANSPLTITLFKDKFRDLAAEKLPPLKYRELYAQSSEAWRNGNIEKALELLSQPGGLVWQEFSIPELNRKKDINERFKVLGSSIDTDRYGEDLMEFYSLLDEHEDVYFIDAIAPEVKNHQKTASDKADKEMELAQKAWNTYIANGGITGVQRVEGRVSEAFRNQAKNLSNAFIHAERGIRLYQAVDVDYTPDWKKLYDEILRAIKLQRRRLNEKKMALEPAILQAKLKLIAEPSNLITNESEEP